MTMNFLFKASFLLATAIFLTSSTTGTLAAESCRDYSGSFDINGRGKFRTCKFIGRKQEKLDKRCALSGAEVHCPRTCGVCDSSAQTTVGLPCVDSPTRFTIKSEYNSLIRSCSWVAKQDTTNRCFLPGVQENCPKECGCESCDDDSSEKFEIIFPAVDLKKSCNWVANQDTATRCALPDVSNVCKFTCGNC